MARPRRIPTGFLTQAIGVCGSRPASVNADESPEGRNYPGNGPIGARHTAGAVGTGDLSEAGGRAQRWWPAGPGGSITCRFRPATRRGAR
ncbi:hypothetical protein; putative signal peptide [Frankia alni ACN14a]|uniref:Uncharacterized protein n=1 Tax=Frankia alni (strain DSM 45986 / CECT 9034 / ACN14a) TaxID=326424 RepID=Q0RFS5_FRAAA|nr:hypothetical protein; putative signal peptide [Frankia alni ACN14a]